MLCSICYSCPLQDGFVAFRIAFNIGLVYDSVGDAAITATEFASCGNRTNQLDGHVNLRDAARGECSFKDPKSGKQYSLKLKVAC